jgi:hypothetical protein
VKVKVLDACSLARVLKGFPVVVAVAALAGEDSLIIQRPPLAVLLQKR